MLGIIGQYAMREVALRRWGFVFREFEHCRGLLGIFSAACRGFDTKSSALQAYKHLRLGSALRDYWA